jgi:hypothetical protein
VLLVGVTGLAHAALELDAAALLHDVRRLVRGGVEIRRAGERDVVAAREAGGPMSCVACCAAPSVCASMPPTSKRPNERWIASKCGSLDPGPEVPRSAASWISPLAAPVSFRWTGAPKVDSTSVRLPGTNPPAGSALPCCSPCELCR